ncbi:hypothetical protein [Herbaspirillum sp. B65]|uniref:hypothetical protein n=1 Tax=Herbaspirillum sp. B65 TaxID=137708 RepID=UPI00131F2237|nr:hypothetical protein [Herbaspirillum sp. B65]
MFDFLYQCINAQRGGSVHAGQPVWPATLGASLRGLILLSSRAHGKAGKYSLFKDLASKGFGGFVVPIRHVGGICTAFRCHKNNLSPVARKKWTKKTRTLGSGFNPHH